MSAQDKLLLKLGKNVDSTRAAFAAKVKASEAKEQRMQRGKILSALISVGLGFVIHFVLTHSQLSPTVIMHELEKKNPPIEVALSNGKPTVIEFYADWCTDCKVMAPKLSKLHATFSPTVNFVVVNGDAPENQDLVSQFRVDGIPHISFIYGGKRIPDTTFIGLVPADVMTQQIDALRARAPLPYQGLELYSDEFEEAYGAE
ncbi:Thiol:disulfide interchange protein TxlA-like [Porphyridium purpureum]|uniref:Thiol:disulfide interchange protein TxlA-like n=1 Tax=Porphyridium purpureum TaxID=35688 RepID=A0A5J4YW86_PORPP|nr:Thiol:disulfide interchange protein TxlA-like [Porphyridium purpureum]|eukprot:POR4664..scf209_3